MMSNVPNVITIELSIDEVNNVVEYVDVIDCDTGVDIQSDFSESVAYEILSKLDGMDFDSMSDEEVSEEVRDALNDEYGQIHDVLVSRI